MTDAGFATPTLTLTLAQYERLVGHCLEGFPEEACGLIAGKIDADMEPTGVVGAVYPTRNADASSRTYTVDSRDLLWAMRDAEAHSIELVGVFHSHTHTDAFPSATDIRQAFEPHWVYVLVSLKAAEPVLRAYRVRDGQVAEIPVVVDDRFAATS